MSAAARDSLTIDRAGAHEPEIDGILDGNARPEGDVKILYAEELARLYAQARLKHFVPLLAMKRARQRLRDRARRIAE